MDSGKLLDAIASAQWFTRLGEAEGSDFVVPIKDLADWKEFISSAREREFGVGHPGDPGFPYSKMSWLPTSNDEPDPIYGTALTTEANERGLASKLVAAKIAAFKIAVQSQRSCGDVPALKSGGNDLTLAALSGGRYACRMAAAEALLGKEGFWCKLVQIYCQGNWPLAILPDRKVVVI